MKSQPTNEKSQLLLWRSKLGCAGAHSTKRRGVAWPVRPPWMLEREGGWEGRKGGSVAKLGLCLRGQFTRNVAESIFFEVDRPTNRRRERERGGGKCAALPCYRDVLPWESGVSGAAFSFLARTHARQDKCGHLASHSHSHSQRDFSRWCCTLRPASCTAGRAGHVRVCFTL